jgi:hypothetical protein
VRNTTRPGCEVWLRGLTHNRDVSPDHPSEANIDGCNRLPISQSLALATAITARMASASKTYENHDRFSRPNIFSDRLLVPIPHFGRGMTDSGSMFS